MCAHRWGLLRYNFALKNQPNLDACLPPFCQCEIGEADRGWFRRFHNNPEMGGIHPECPLEIDILKLVISFAMVCSVLWFAAGCASFSASSYGKKRLILLSICLYFIGYIIFLGLFGAIMSQINIQNSCLDRSLLCEELKKKFKRSGNEFMVYSICAFVLITLSIIFTFCSAFIL